MTALALCVEGARPFGYGLTATAKTELGRSTPDSPTADRTLDASGFVCPIPILKAKRRSVTWRRGDT